MNIDRIKSNYVYHPKTGEIYRTCDGRSPLLPYVSRGTARVRMRVEGKVKQPSVVIYALVHGVVPDGLRTTYLDGDATNLRLENLSFSVRSGPGARRLAEQIIDLMATREQMSTRSIIAALGYADELPCYMRLLARQGRVHATGIERIAGRDSIVWSLGPQPPGVAALLPRSYRKRSQPAPSAAALRDSWPSREQLRREATESVDRARLGKTPNSIFAAAASFSS